LVEQRIRNAKVVGSTPIIGTISNSSQAYRNPLKARMLRFLAHILSPVINGTQPASSHSWGISGGILCSVQRIDPSFVRKKEKLVYDVQFNTFQAVALEWHGTKVSRWSADYASDILEAFNKDLFPYIE
jgi:hypothetical protein